MKQRRILVVDDEPGIRQSLSGVLEDEGYAVEAVESGEACLEAIPRGGFELVLLDIWLPGIDGMEVLARIQEIPFTERPVVVVISGHGSIEAAVKATKLGAFDFLEKPLSIEKVTVVVKNGLDHRSLSLENSRLKADTRLALPHHRGQRAHQGVAPAAFAHGGHQRARPDLWRKRHRQGTGGACAPRAQPASGRTAVRRGELRGHSRGADRKRDVRAQLRAGNALDRYGEAKTGKFQKADGGTLFLDEVGDMSLRTQAKVLRVLEEQRFEPVGAAESMQVDVRVVAATNKNLEEEIERGNFREDLFYRLNVIPFFVPPLRDRREDVPQLADHFLREFTTAYGRKPKELTPEAYQVLAEYHWPGNVRELKNLIERIVILNPQVRVDARHIPLNAARRQADRPLDRFGSLQEVREAAEREYILKKLEETSGNVTRTAELLGLERSNLYRKMKTLGIGPKD